jgi:cytoskeletal protein RodZ
MSTPNSDRVRGELLREWRLGQQIDVSDLARRVNLSAAQIQQLESGGISLFYSEAIKQSSARKVAKALGQEPESVIRPISNEGGGTETAVMSLQVLDDLIQLSEQRKNAQQKASGGSRQFVRWFLGLSVLLVLGAFAAVMHLQPASLTHWVVEQWARFPSEWVPMPEPKMSESVFLTKASEPTVAAAPVALEASVPTQADMATLGSPVSANSESAHALTANEASSAVALTLPESLCQSNEQGTLLMSTIPSKAGNMVHIVPIKAGSVCAKDGSGKSTLLTLQPKEGRSVYGSPPWRLYFEHTDQAQIFFQGERLRWPEVSTRAILLREVKFQ